MKQIIRPTLSVLLPALAAASGLLLAPSAFAGVEMTVQDRDVARSVSLGGSCNRCELSGRNLSGATFTGAASAFTGTGGATGAGSAGLLDSAGFAGSGSDAFDLNNEQAGKHARHSAATLLVKNFPNVRSTRIN